MKQLFIAGNWKAHKTNLEARDWVQVFADTKSQLTNIENKEVIVCPPFTLLSLMRNLFDEHRLLAHIGSQDVSMFEVGAFTGEVPAEMLKEFVTYSIIGHSERRQNLHETDEMLAKKVAMAKQSNIGPIFCVQNENTPIPEGVSLVAFEPVEAIGSGHPDTPEDANRVAQQVKEKNSGVKFVLYGGSITPENVNSFTVQEAIDGVLVGGASLDATKFSQIIQNA